FHLPPTTPSVQSPKPREFPDPSSYCDRLDLRDVADDLVGHRSPLCLTPSEQQRYCRITSTGAPISAGWRLPWNRMKRRIQPTYDFSVLRLPWRSRLAARTRSSSLG